MWGPRLLQLFNYMLGVAMVVGMGFTFAGMVRRRELVASIASGLSLQRMSRPVLLVALALTGLQALNYEFLMPRVAHLLPMLLLARVDGKSPVEYLDKAQQDLIREFVPKELGRGPQRLDAVQKHWFESISFVKT